MKRTECIESVNSQQESLGQKPKVANKTWDSSFTTQGGQRHLYQKARYKPDCSFVAKFQSAKGCGWEVEEDKSRVFMATADESRPPKQ